MNDSDKIAVFGIIINAILFMGSMAWSWFLTKKTIRATSPKSSGWCKSKRKRCLTVTERRFLRNFRLIELGTILVIVTQPFGHFLFNSFPPRSKLEFLSAILTGGVVIMFSSAIVSMERNEIRQIKSGEFMKRLKTDRARTTKGSK